jgi:hypothetical protein
MTGLGGRRKALAQHADRRLGRMHRTRMECIIRGERLAQSVSIEQREGHSGCLVPRGHLGVR